MPQTPTANMLLIKPTELGDSGVWASLLDSMFDLIDSHDHSASKGVQVPMFTGVRVAADIPWSSGGTFYAIKDLKAIDFQPSPQSAMTGFTGALFVDSANNELSYRTVGGAIIKFTNGSAFNFAAIGAIGGDYTTAGALVDYVDANGLYRMRQEVAAGAQQWAIVQTGGLDLFEFKLHPAVGVPANRIRQKSPAALAGSYDMTWPGALPAVKGLLALDSAGLITTVPPLPASIRLMQIDNLGVVSTPAAALPATSGIVTISAAGVITYQTGPYMYHASAAQPNGIGTCVYDGTQWALGAGSTLSCPITLPVGSSFATWKIYLSKLSSGAGTINVSLREINMLTHSVATIGAVQSTAANAPGDIQLTGAGTTILADRSYWINYSCTGASGDFLYGWSATP